MFSLLAKRMCKSAKIIHHESQFRPMKIAPMAHRGLSTLSDSPDPSKDVRPWDRRTLQQLTIELEGDSLPNLESGKLKAKILSHMGQTIFRGLPSAESNASSNSAVVVVLATPSLAPWLEHDGIIPAVLKLLKLPGNTKIDTVCACVDGIAPGKQDLKKGASQSSKQGLSILYSPSNEIASDIWDKDITQEEPYSGVLSNLTFSSRAGGVKVTLPLANTMFTNGRDSTLLVSRWRYLDDGSIEQTRSPSPRVNQVLRILDNSTGLTSQIPALPLTPARRIISGMGNIIRQLEFDDGPGPASRELETSIDNYFEAKKTPKSKVDVWALIVPRKAISNQELKQSNTLPTSQDSIRESWQYPVANPGLVGYWIEQGATFCRVLSGGGGWGIKQGLLSLDPQTTYGDVIEPRFDTSTQSIEEQQASALGSLANPDSSIQFFLAEREPKILAMPQDKMRVVLGTLPSSIDDLPKARDNHDTLRPVNFYDHFGAMSETGIFLTSSGTNVDSAMQTISSARQVSTKIDLPYSVVVGGY